MSSFDIKPLETLVRAIGGLPNQRLAGACDLPSPRRANVPALVVGCKMQRSSVGMQMRVYDAL